MLSMWSMILPLVTRNQKSRSLLPQARRRRHKPARLRWPGFRPSLERLEDRTVLSGGALDPTFGTGGVVFTASLPNSGGDKSLAVQADGKIIEVSSFFQQNHWHSAVARYNQDGSPDRSFGPNLSGLLTLDFSSYTDSEASGVTLQPDGKILVAGDAWTSSADDFAVARLKSDGSLDPSFNNTGEETISIFVNSPTTYVNDVALSADGTKIVLAGESDTTTDAYVAAVRLNSDNGSLDTNFGTGGKATAVTSLRVQSTALQADGNIVFAGFSNQGFEAVRLNSVTGGLDTTFGTGGVQTVSFSPSHFDWCFSVALQPDSTGGQKIILAGWTGLSTGYYMSVARLKSDGSLDPTFNDPSGQATGSGQATVGLSFPSDFPPFAEFSRVGMAVQTDGKIVVASTSLTSSGDFDFTVGRLNSNGSLDNSFGTNGTVTNDFGPDSEPNAVAFQPDGKILVGGFGSGNFALARYDGGALNVTTQAAAQLQQVITTANLSGQPDQITFQISAQADMNTMLAVINALPAATTDVTITLDLGGGTYSTGGVALNPPSNVNVVIQNGTLDPAFPALTVAGGNVKVLGCTLVTTGNVPTIVVTGGQLTLRNDQVSTGYNQTAIAVSGGSTVDLGTTASPGGNVININGAGQALVSTGQNSVTAAGNTFQANGTPVASALASVALTFSVDSSKLNQPVIITATVTPLSSGSVPNGTVTFFDATTGTPLGLPVSLVNGRASLPTTALSAGGKIITARYNGDANFTASGATQQVHYQFSGFLPPFDQDNSYNLGRVLPIKFQLTDYAGNVISNLSAVLSIRVQAIDAQGNPLGAPFIPIPAAGTGLRYDATAHQFVYNWDTTGLAAGHYRILLTLDDGMIWTLDLWLK
jgi:uncharacterized delta-60 repeat protein